MIDSQARLSHSVTKCGQKQHSQARRGHFSEAAHDQPGLPAIVSNKTALRKRKRERKRENESIFILILTIHKYTEEQKIVFSKAIVQHYRGHTVQQCTQSTICSIWHNRQYNK